MDVFTHSSQVSHGIIYIITTTVWHNGQGSCFYLSVTRTFLSSWKILHLYICITYLYDMTSMTSTMTISIWQHYGWNWLDLHFQCKSRNTMCPCVQSHVLKPYYGWGWNGSSLVLHISDSNQGVYNIYNIIIFIITVITRKDVRSCQEGESWYFWVSSVQAEITYYSWTVDFSPPGLR